MDKYKVSAVSYINTIPFLYGITRSSELAGRMELSVDYPSMCAQKVMERRVDIGLVPVALLLKMPQLDIISDYCIGADGAVESVFLLSNSPLDEIDEILLDYQSMTSVNLVRVLAANYWKIYPKWSKATPDYEKNITDRQAAVIIGDRAFLYKNKYKYAYDLPAEWKKYTGLPFVFAVWAANREVDSEFLKLFNDALLFGLNNINAALDAYSDKVAQVKHLFDPYLYLTQYIDYKYDDLKRRSLTIFFEQVRQLQTFEIQS